MPGLTDAHRYELDLRGVLVIPDVLRRKEVDRLLAAVAEQPRATPTNRDIMSQRLQDLVPRHQAFRDLLDHPVALAVVGELIGRHVRLDHSYGILMRPGNDGLGLHGGGAPHDPAQHYLWRDGRMHNGLVVLSWALVDGGPGDGGFGCIPGSHKANLPLPRGAEHLAVEVPAPAGSLLVFTEALTHCTVPWRATHDRVALLYKYSPGSSSWDRPTAVAPDLAAVLTDRQRRLLEPPYVGGRQPTF